MGQATDPGSVAPAVELGCDGPAYDSVMHHPLEDRMTMACPRRDVTILFVLAAFLAWSAAALHPCSANAQSSPMFTVDTPVDVAAAPPLDNGICASANGNGC